MAYLQQAAIAATYNSSSTQLRTALQDAVVDRFDRLTSWRDADADAFAASVTPMVEGAQQAMAAMTDAYLAAILADMIDEGVEPVGVELPDDLRGVDSDRVYRRPFLQIWTDLAGGALLKAAIEAGRRRAEGLATTDLQLAKTHASRIVLQQQRQRIGSGGGGSGSGRKRVVGYRRVLTGAENCAMCVLASTQRYHIKDLLPIHPGCVPEGTPVSAEGVRAVTRRRYSGELIVITTASGDEVTVTPNHPVLTARGWVPGQFVGEGDDVVRRGVRHGAVGGGPQEGHRPALVEDVWRAASMAGRLVSVPLAAEDFHGDGAHGEVDVVRTDGHLAPVGDVAFGQPVGELLLVPGHGGRSLLDGGGAEAALLPRSDASGARGVSRGSLRFPLGSRHLCGTHEASVRSAAGLDTLAQERRPYGSSLDAVRGGQGQFGSALEVLVGDLLGGQVAPRATPTRFDPAGAEFTGEGLRVYADQGRRLLSRMSGQVELDRVVLVRRINYSSHVYNLHTAEGWYTASDHIVSNCDCAVSPIVGRQDPGQLINSVTVTEGAQAVRSTSSGVNVFNGDNLVNLGDLLEPLHEEIEKRFGISDRGGRRIDYRKLLTVREHGEIGPVLTVKGQKFTSAADLPNR